MLSTTLTNNRIINGAVVKYKIDNNYYLTIQIEGNHLIAIDTYCKINITGLDIVSDKNNNNIFNGVKIFKAINSSILETVYDLQYFYDNVNLQVISGTPVVTTANTTWIVDVNNKEMFNFKLINSAIVNFNNAKIKITAFTSNGTETVSDIYNDGTGSLFSLHEKYLQFFGYAWFVLSLQDSPNSATNIPIIIEEV